MERLNNILQDIYNYVRIEYPWNATSDTQKFAGLLIHIFVVVKMEALRA